MFRCYCWLIFFTIALFSTWALPAENEDGIVEGTIVDGEENDKAVLDIADRYLRRKPNKHRNDDDSSSSSSWDDDGKQSKIKCVCLGKKPFAYTLERYPPRPSKPRPSSGSSYGDSSSQRPNGQNGSNNNNGQRP